MKKNIQLVGLIVIMASLVLSGCGKSPTNLASSSTQETSAESTTQKLEEDIKDLKPEVKLSFMLSQAKWKDVYQAMADEIEKDEHIAIEFQVIPDDQYFALVKTKLSIGEVPDIIQYNTPTQNLELNVQENIVDLSEEPWVERLVNPSLLKDLNDGKIYAMPLESSSFFGPVYYNQEVFQKLGISEEQPKTYEAFMDVLREIKAKGNGIIPVYSCNKDSWTTQVFTTLGFGVATIKNPDIWYKLLNNEVNWADVPEFKQVLDEYMMIYNEELTNTDHLSATYDMAKEAVATGEAAMMLNGEWAANDIMAKWPETQLGSWIIPFADELLMGTGAYVQGFFVTKEGQSEDAKRFLSIWSQPKYQDMYWAANPGFPGFSDVTTGETIPAVQKLVDDYIKTGKYAYQMNDQISEAAPILPELWKYYVEMTAGSKTSEEVLQSWDKKFKDYMKSKEMLGF